MDRRLPPLNSLRAFEVAARHLSFTKAADELCVTQAAVSHQIKSLEAYLNIELFKRQPHNLKLTEEGQRLAPVLTKGFNYIAEELSNLRFELPQGKIKVRLPPSFASKWLSPRLMEFWHQYPDISLSLQHSNQPVDFSKEDVDIAITYGQGEWSGVEAISIMSLDYFPVASPSFLSQRPPITQPKDMANYYLLHDANYDAWPAWFSFSGTEKVHLKSGYVFDDTNVLIQAAIDGQGFALCPSKFVDQYLQQGSLVKVFEHTLKTDYAYYVCCPKHYLIRPGVKEFRNWLLQQTV